MSRELVRAEPGLKVIKEDMASQWPFVIHFNMRNETRNVALCNSHSQRPRKVTCGLVSGFLLTLSAMRHHQAPSCLPAWLARPAGVVFLLHVWAFLLHVFAAARGCLNLSYFERRGERYRRYRYLPPSASLLYPQRLLIRFLL